MGHSDARFNYRAPRGERAVVLSILTIGPHPHTPEKKANQPKGVQHLWMHRGSTGGEIAKLFMQAYR